ncbi:MAG: non-ribosomal peptide synthetase, partial [Acidimicrobiales bacterium]
MTATWPGSTSDDTELAALSPSAKRALLERLLGSKDNQPDLEPLSLPQERLWFLEQLKPGEATYNIPTSIPIRGTLDLPALERSVQEIVWRHEPLRTTFSSRGHEPVQVIWRHRHIPVQVEDLRHLARSSRDREVARISAGEAFRPFDLGRGPLLRVVLVRVTDAESTLLVTMHHIISDGWSMNVFAYELTTLYQAFTARLPSPLPALRIQYREFARRQRQELRTDVLEDHLAYWREQLSGAPELLVLPTDKPRPSVQGSRGYVQPFTVGPATADGLRRLSREEGATLFITLLAAFKVFLHRHTGDTDLIVGAPVANRNRPDLEPLIGFFVNTLILRTDVSGGPSFRELLRRVRDVALGAYAHQDMPFEKIVEDLQPERDLSRNPVFQVVFAFQAVGVGQDAFSEMPHGPLPISETQMSKFDITLGMGEAGNRITGGLECNADLFHPETVSRMAERLTIILDAIVEQPDLSIGHLPVAPAAERRQVLVEWNRTSAAAPRACFHHLFERQVDRTPDAVAAEFHGASLTYGELDERANQLANHLIGRGARPETRIGVCLERGLHMAVAVLGVMKSGAAYVPLDPNAPARRLRMILDDAGVEVVLTQNALTGRFDGMQCDLHLIDPDAGSIDSESNSRPDAAVDPQNLAYLIYTSGSTGAPKGIMVPHLGVCNMGASEVRDFRIKPSDRVLQVAPLIFDVSIWEMAMTWFAGATLVFATEDEIVGGEVIGEEHITVASFTPSLLATLDPARYPRMRTVMSVGEACTERIAAAWAPGRRLINVYGPTETTGHCATIDLTGPDVTIGRPIHNVRLYVLTEAMEPTPVGVPGELHVSSPGTTRGYANRPDLTAERFVPDPFSPQPGARLYKTGDLVRYRPDGRLEFLGRLDHQVKLRGFRLELGEIESILSASPGIAEAVVVLREDRPGDKRLVAYVVAEEGAECSADELRRTLRASLPAYMVPAHIVALDSFPLNANRKLDHRALPPPEAVRVDDDDHP